MDATLDSLVSALETDPASAQARSLMEEIVWRALDHLQRPDREQLAAAAALTGTAASRLFARAGDAPSAWLAWFAGQLQLVSLLHRAAAERELPAEVRTVLRWKNVPAMLQALREGDRTLSALARAAGVRDLAQTSREVGGLAACGLVRTMKGGREKWVTLSSLGHRAVGHLEPEAVAEPLYAEMEETNAFAESVTPGFKVVVNPEHARVGEQSEAAGFKGKKRRSARRPVR